MIHSVLTPPSAAECFELGRFAYIAEDFYHTALWMWQALKLESDEVNKTMERTEILDYLAYALAMVRVIRVKRSVVHR